MMDKKMLEYVAKVAGYYQVDGWNRLPEFGMRWVDDNRRFVRYWNPFNDDGDAFRLIVKLGMMVDMEPFEAVVYYAVGKFIRVVPSDTQTLGESARIAIVAAVVQYGIVNGVEGYDD
jgi:hypothetical protein